MLGEKKARKRKGANSDLAYIFGPVPLQARKDGSEQSSCCVEKSKYHKYMKVFFRSLTATDIVTFITLTMN